MSLIGQKSRKTVLFKKICDTCKCLEGTLDRNDEEAYEDAWERLNQGSGQTFVQQKAFRDRLSRWLKTQSKETDFASCKWTGNIKRLPWKSGTVTKTVWMDGWNHNITMTLAGEKMLPASGILLRSKHRKHKLHVTPWLPSMHHSLEATNEKGNLKTLKGRGKCI